MRYLIDGYNYLFRAIRAGGDLQAQREAVVEELNRLASLLSLDITVVFDGASPFREATKGHFYNIEIRFSHEREEADDLLVKLVRRSEHPQRLTVVTDDGKLAWRVRMEGGKTLGTSEFKSMLGKREQRKAALPKSKPPAPKLLAPPRRKAERLESPEDELLVTFEERLKKLEKDNPKPAAPPSRRSSAKKRSKGKKPKELEERIDWESTFEERLRKLEEDDTV